MRTRAIISMCAVTYSSVTLVILNELRDILQCLRYLYFKYSERQDISDEMR